MEQSNDNRGVLASLMGVGWSIQTILNILTDKTRPIAYYCTLLGIIFVTLLTWAMFDPDIGAAAVSNLTYHPIYMGFAYLVFMNSGQYAYTKGSPRVDGLMVGYEKGAQRWTHGILMVLAVIFSMIGYYYIYIDRKELGLNQLGLEYVNSQIARALHAWLGYAVIFFTLAQAFTGPAKHWFRLKRDGTKVFKRHGKAGRLITIAGVFNCTWGVWLKLDYVGDGWSTCLKLLMTSLGAIIFFSLIIMVYSNPEDPKESPEGDSQVAQEGENNSIGSVPVDIRTT